MMSFLKYSILLKKIISFSLEYLISYMPVRMEFVDDVAQFLRSIPLFVLMLNL